MPLAAQSTLSVPVVRPLRLTVKMNGVLPLLPSGRLASVAAMLKARSSLRMVPVALPWAIVPPCGADSSTRKLSSGSASVSPATAMVRIALAWPGAKLMLPASGAPAGKSGIPAELAATPVTTQATLPASAVLPLRLTVKVNGVLPLSPSGLLALSGAISRLLSTVTAAATRTLAAPLL